MFDILRYTKELEGSGWSEAQANTLIKVMSSFMNQNFSTKADFEKLNLATKHEFDLLRKDMDAKFSEVRKDMDAGFADVRKDMLSMENGLRKDMQTLHDKLLIKLSSGWHVCFVRLWHEQAFGIYLF